MSQILTLLCWPHRIHFRSYSKTTDVERAVCKGITAYFSFFASKMYRLFFHVAKKGSSQRSPSTPHALHLWSLNMIWYLFNSQQVSWFFLSKFVILWIDCADYWIHFRSYSKTTDVERAVWKEITAYFRFFATWKKSRYILEATPRSTQKVCSIVFEYMNTGALECQKASVGAYVLGLINPPPGSE